MRVRVRFQGRAGELVSSRETELTFSDGRADLEFTEDEMSDDRWVVALLDELEGDRAGWTTVVADRSRQFHGR